MPAPTLSSSISNTTTSTTTLSNPPPTLLTLPTEIRLKIYTHILTTSNIHSFRPQRKIGWNRPHADLTNPALLFESDAHVSLKCLFHSRLTKGDHALLLETVLKLARVLVIEHADFVSLVKVVGAGSGSGAVSLSSPGSSHGQPRSLAAIVRTHLRTIDFSDRMDEIICQPNDIVKLIKGLPGLRSICLTSRHVQRYSGTVEEHVEFTRERAERERTIGISRLLEKGLGCQDDTDTSTSTSSTPAETASELRRLTLRSPMTDGNRMMISPALFNRSLSLSQPSTPTPTTTINAKSSTKPTWVVVDLSLLIWQHFLYNGAPYRDHWRTIKMNTLLDVARTQGVDVVMGLRNVEFDPSRVPGRGEQGGSGSTGRRKMWLEGSVFRGEMSTRDWVLRLRRVGGGRGAGACGGGAGGPEYCVRQRRAFDEVVGQGDLEGGGLVAGEE